MPVNFGSLSPIKPSQVIANLAPEAQGDSIGDLFSGLSSLLGTSGKAPTAQPGSPIGSVNPQHVQNSITNPAALDSRPRLNQIVDNQGIFKNAMGQLGLKESNPALTQYLAKANPKLDPSITPWCAGYVGSVLNASGMKGTGSLMAKSYLKYGNPTNNPTQGDIVVLNRGSDPRYGHVGFVESIDYNKGVVNVLGGNQGNSVSIKSFPLGQVAGFRQPPTGQQVQQFAQQNKIQDPKQLMQITENKHPELPSVMKGIAHVESFGSKNPYALMSKPTGKDRAYGKYQIMGANIPSWTQEALGQKLTPEQFLSNPEAQERTAAYHLNKHLQKGYSPEDVASIWFSGRPQKKAGNARDVYGTTVPAYIQKFNKGRQTLNSEQPLIPGYVPMPNQTQPKPRIAFNDYNANGLDRPVGQGFMTNPAPMPEWNPPQNNSQMPEGDPNYQNPYDVMITGVRADNQRGINWGLLSQILKA
jgi:uncharacterized protein (TIGR02594 family)